MKDTVFKTIHLFSLIAIAILLYRIGTTLEKVVIELHQISIK